MNPTFEWGINFIQALQRLFGTAGDDLGTILTFLGNQEFYLLLFPFLFWCVDWAIGARLTILYLLSVVLNTDTKDIIHQARPYELADVALVDPAGDYVYGEGFGMPSGHAQWSLTIWGALAMWMRQTWFWVLSVLLVFAIGISRVLLGVHFPTQILAGWGLGIVVVGLYLAFHLNLEKWLRELGVAKQLLVAVLVPAFLMLTHFVPDNVAASGVLLGLGVGLTVSHHYVPFSVAGNWGLRLARYGIGIVVLLGIYLGLSAMFPGEEEAFYIPFRFLRYSLIGLWISLGAPWLFSRVRLAPRAWQPA
jgi:membrane-associated phospholipid phosphatase